jgi:hypothetical protein
VGVGVRKPLRVCESTLLCCHLGVKRRLLMPGAPTTHVASPLWWLVYAFWYALNATGQSWCCATDVRQRSLRRCKACRAFGRRTTAGLQGMHSTCACVVVLTECAVHAFNASSLSWGMSWA